VKCSCLLLASLIVAPRLHGQERPDHPIRWWHAAAAVGAIGVASLFDGDVNDWMRDHRSSGSNAAARVFRNGGEPLVVLGISGGILAAGVISGRPPLERSGGRVLTSVVVAGATTAIIKRVIGRVRPSDTTDPYVFQPFSDHDAFPSGHATVAFALATSLSEEIDNRWATAGLYAFAAGTAWSRVNDQRHWLSDVLAGAAVGFITAKLIEAHPPHFLVDPPDVRVEWRVAF
jgi:membrane-associated phospholipid phosphatase